MLHPAQTAVTAAPPIWEHLFPYHGVHYCFIGAEKFSRIGPLTTFFLEMEATTLTLDYYFLLNSAGVSEHARTLSFVICHFKKCIHKVEPELERKGRQSIAGPVDWPSLLGVKFQKDAFSRDAIITRSVKLLALAEDEETETRNLKSCILVLWKHVCNSRA